MDRDRNESGGELPREQDQNAAGSAGGGQMGGGPGAEDMGAGGGSSGAGGYGNAQNQANHQGQQRAEGPRSDAELSRGERFDEQQSGGRGRDSVSRAEPDPEEIAADQAAHQERGQSLAEAESDGQDGG